MCLGELKIRAKMSASVKRRTLYGARLYTWYAVYNKPILQYILHRINMHLFGFFTV